MMDDLNHPPRMRCGDCGKELRRLHRTNADGTPKGDRDGHFWGCPECSTLLTPVEFSRQLRALRHRWHEARRAAGIEDDPRLPALRDNGNVAEIPDAEHAANIEELAARLSAGEAGKIVAFLRSIGELDSADEFTRSFADARRRLGLPPANGAMNALPSDIVLVGGQLGADREDMARRAGERQGHAQVTS